MTETLHTLETRHQLKSPEAHQVAMETFFDLQQRPIGRNRDENFGMPKNYVPPPARIYVVNHSRTRPWKWITNAVSHLRGADEVLAHNKKLRELYTADAMYKRVEAGRDMNEYGEGLRAVALNVRIPGGPDGKGGSYMGKYIPVPPSKGDGPDIRVEVPEGAWDLYLGNYEKMRSEDSEEKSAELTRLNHSWSRRHNPVFRFTDDGVSTDIDNPFGILEFIRIPVRAVETVMDREYLTALDLVEVQ